MEHKSVPQYVDSLLPNQSVELQGSGKNMPWIITKYLQYKTYDVFSGAFDATEFGPLPVSVPLASPSQISAAAALLKTAKNPVIVIGSQATLGAQSIRELQAAVGVLGAPTFLGGMARGLMGRNHALHIRQGRGDALRRADVVLLLGAVCDFRMDYGRTLSPNSKVIIVNRSSNDLTINSGFTGFWKATQSVQADPGSFLKALAAEVKDAKAASWADWAAQLKDQEIKKEKGNSEKAGAKAYGRATGSENRSQDSLVNPLALCETVEQMLDDDSIIVADGGDFVATMSYIVRPRGPLTWLDPGAYGTLGVGAGFALGAKLCRPESEVWLVWGDGSAGYSIAEYDTFKRHGVSVIGLIGNDACWTQIAREQLPMLGAETACPLEYTAYHLVAEGYGGKGIEIRSADDDVPGKIKQAQEIAKSGAPVVLNVHIGGTDFREGSLSV